ncbi:MAG: outer membrane beta-barrel domain-containing protein [Nitrospiria bacterium]
MAGRIKIVLGFILLFQTATVFAQGPQLPQDDAPLITPPVEERQIVEPKIDQEFLEVTPFYGFYSIEGFSASPVYGVRAALYISEAAFLEGNYGMTKADSDAFTARTGTFVFTDHDVSYWNVNVSYNLFPGQIFLTRRRTLNSTIYLAAGVGQTEFDTRTRFTLNVGTGYRIFFTDWMDAGFRLAVHSFETDLSGVKDRLFNLEGTVGIGFFF